MQRPYTSDVMAVARGGDYGSLPGPHKGADSINRRIVPIAISLILHFCLPSVLFACMFGVLAFAMHYTHRSLCYFILALGAVIVAISLLVAALAVRRKRKGDTSVRAASYVFLSVSLVVAFVLGVTFGSTCYKVYMSKYYDMTTLSLYPNVDVSYVGGAEVMDAGRIVFSTGSKLNTSMTMGYKDGSTYCVAPIVTASPTRRPMVSFDFWAVGKDCCSGNPLIKSDYTCAEFDNPRAHSGMRLLDSDLPYKLAVEQAKLAYNIHSDHPLFFHWVEDPIGEVSSLEAHGFNWFILAVLIFSALQLFAVIVAAVAIPKFLSAA